MTITNYTNFIPSSSFISNNEINLIFIIDYKSIALPAELQGHKCFVVLFKRLSSYFFLLIYIMKSDRSTV